MRNLEFIADDLRTHKDPRVQCTTTFRIEQVDVGGNVPINMECIKLNLLPQNDNDYGD